MKEYTEELEQEVKKLGLEENLMTCEKCNTRYFLSREKASLYSLYQLMECKKCHPENKVSTQLNSHLFWDFS